MEEGVEHCWPAGHGSHRPEWFPRTPLYVAAGHETHAPRVLLEYRPAGHRKRSHAEDVCVGVSVADWLWEADTDLVMEELTTCEGVCVSLGVCEPVAVKVPDCEGDAVKEGV